jgi:hypothetical protein
MVLAVVFVCAAATATIAGGAPAGREPASHDAAGPDTDHDGLADDLEIRRYRTDPRKRDTDHDGLDDAAEVRRYRTNPRTNDTDRDGLTDGAEARRFRTDPRRRDTDRDGLFDGDEVNRYKTNPRERDSDGDGWGDRAEIRNKKDPRNARDRPGFPREDNAGVPRGTPLTAYTGPEVITTPNTVIAGKTMGCIEIRAPGVVIRNSKISCPGGAVYIDDRSFTGKPLTIEDTTIDCQNQGGTGIQEAHFVVRRVDISGCENGFSINQDVVIEDSYVHNLASKGEESHEDGIQLSLGHWNGVEYVCCALNVTIRHNTIYGMTRGDTAFGTSAIIGGPPGTQNILIENNLLAGGAYALYCPGGGQGTNFRVVDNHFSTKFGPRVGAFGATTECADENASGNVVHETGRPVNLQ